MSVAHSAHFASPPYLLPGGEGIGEHIEPDGEGIADTLARLADRLAVLATAAHIMERRAPRDVYARSIAHEACVLALDMRDTLHRAQAGAPMRSPRIVDASPASKPDTAPEDAPVSRAPSRKPTDGETIRHDPGELCPFPGCCHWFNDPCADCLAVEQGRAPTARHSTARQTPPQARQRRARAQASDSTTHSPASPQPSLASSGDAEGGAQ